MVKNCMLFPLLGLTSIGSIYFAFCSDRVFRMWGDEAFPRSAPFPDKMLLALNDALHSAHLPTEGLEMDSHLYGVSFVTGALAVLFAIVAAATGFILWKSRRPRVVPAP